MGCVQSGVEGYFVPPATKDEHPDVLTTRVRVEHLPRSAQQLLLRLNVLGACFLTVAAYFVSVMAYQRRYDHLGAAGIALLQASLVRRTAVACETRTLERVTHLHSCFWLFLVLTASKGFATLVSAAREGEANARGEGSNDGTVFGLEYGTVSNLSAMAVLGYLTYVAALCFQRLAQWCLFLSASRLAVQGWRAPPGGQRAGTDTAGATETLEENA
jgi:hypothetical protein